MADVSKIRIKMGQIEVEYEGSEAFLKEDLQELLAGVSKLYAESGGSLRAPTSAAAGVVPVVTAGRLQLTTGTIAGRLQSSSGPDLIEAAAVRLHLAEGAQSFTRQKLLEEMQGAPTFYRASYSKNLSKYLAVLVKGGRLNEVSKDNYSLTTNALSELRVKIDPQGIAQGPTEQV